jgi:hypothetical protein
VIIFEKAESRVGNNAGIIDVWLDWFLISR